MFTQIYCYKPKDAAGDSDDIRLSLPFIPRLRGGYEQGNRMYNTAIFEDGR